ncbi:MAG: DinB family protein [Chloroflexota bacterium]|nr:MAG: Mini-circle protein [Chloroflexota bacterium]
MTQITRTDPPKIADERTSLTSWLDYERATLALKCQGLPADQLRERAVPPSTLSLLGLIRHMSEVERGWFVRTLKGEKAEDIYCTDADPDGDFDGVDTAGVDEAFATWSAECERARSLVAAAPSFAVVGRKRDGEEISLRWILVHMIEEYARHNGHADLLRQRIDGAVGE